MVCFNVPKAFGLEHLEFRVYMKVTQIMATAQYDISAVFLASRRETKVDWLVERGKDQSV